MPTQRPVVLAGSRSGTARRIAEALQAAGVEAYYRPDDYPRHALVVRWSSGGDKIFEAERLTAAGIPLPRYSLSPQPGWFPRRRHHMQGRDFVNPPVVPDFWTEPVYTPHEFRVHVLHDVAFRTQYKLPPEDQQPIIVSGVPIRNNQLGWRFSPQAARERFTGTVLDQVRDVARAAVRVLRYDLGAVDIGLKADGQPLIYEVNTRPSMEDHTFNAYVQALIRLAQQ